MPSVRLEIQTPSGGWVPAGSVGQDEPCGSISSNGERRQVYVFGFRDEVAGVWRSGGGVDVANSAVREVHTIGLDLVADLADGPTELDVVTPRGAERRLRFTFDPDGAS